MPNCVKHQIKSLSSPSIRTRWVWLIVYLNIQCKISGWRTRVINTGSNTNGFKAKHTDNSIKNTPEKWSDFLEKYPPYLNFSHQLKNLKVFIYNLHLTYILQIYSPLIFRKIKSDLLNVLNTLFLIPWTQEAN